MMFGTLDTEKRPVLIAEIGNNHEGSESTAYELVDAALKAGADIVKVQIIHPSRLVNISQKERIEQLSRYRLKLEVFAEMRKRTKDAGKQFMASVFDCDSLREYLPILDGVKIASGDLDFHPLLEIAASSGKPVILSTGMAELREVKESIRVVQKALPKGTKLTEQLAVLHCVSLYPCPLEQANLSAIQTLEKKLKLTIGYSDHTLGIESAVVALALGAKIIEKHFTLDKTKPGFRDHALSADPVDFSALAKVVHSFRDMLGDGKRDAVSSDLATRNLARRSIVAARDLVAGAQLKNADLDFVRPAGGTPPPSAKEMIGKTMKRAVKQHEPITLLDLE